MSLKHFLKSALENVTGYYIHKKSDLPVGVDLKYDIAHKLKKISLHTIFDVGANTGQTAVKFSQSYPGAKIYSFEPISSTFQKLVENTKKYPAIICKNIAFGDRIERMEVNVFDEKDSELNSLVSTNMNRDTRSPTETIYVTTIDEFLTQNNIPGIDLLKIDTEGFEINVLNGATETLRQNKIKLIYVEVGLDNQVNKRHQNFVDIQNYLTQHNFVFFGFYEIAHSLLPARFHFSNALYVHANHI
jgi:FkbM family methyltransferase